MSSPSELLDCPHSSRCAGCPLSDMPYGEQLQRKKAALECALEIYPALSRLSLPLTEPAEPDRAYRVRAKLVAKGKMLGLFAKGSHEVVDIPNCRVLTPRVAEAVAAVRSALPFEFPLLGLDAREVDAGVLVTLTVAPDVAERRVARVADDLMRAHPLIVGVSLSRRAPRSPQLLGSTPQPLTGSNVSEHRFGADAPYQLATPGSFVQAHVGQAHKLYQRIASTLEGELGGLAGRRILELYAGGGSLSLLLAQRGARVTCADSFAPGLTRAQDAALAQKLELEVLEADAETALRRTKHADAIVVDPPRRGLSPAVRLGIAANRPRVVAYVSCEPSTLARDLSHLAELGLVTRHVGPWDMIPQSEAVEALALLTPGDATPLRVLFEDEDLIAVDKPAQLPTTPQGEYSHSLLRAVQRLPSAELAVPAHRLDLGTSGVCLFARFPAAAERISTALARGSKQYLALVQGITHKRGRIERSINDGSGVRDALTHYQRERVVGTHSLVRAFPATGRRHQIRRHLASIGHPLLGDARYGNPAANRHFEERYGLDRPFLHLARVELDFAGHPLVLEASLPPELEAVLATLAQSSRK